MRKRAKTILHNGFITMNGLANGIQATVFIVRFPPNVLLFVFNCVFPLLFSQVCPFKVH